MKNEITMIMKSTLRDSIKEYEEKLEDKLSRFATEDLVVQYKALFKQDPDKNMSDWDLCRYILYENVRLYTIYILDRLDEIEEAENG